METVTILQDVGTWGRLGTVRWPEMEDGRSFEYHGLRGYEKMPIAQCNKQAQNALKRRGTLSVDKAPVNREHTRQFPRSTRWACQRCVSPVEMTSRDVLVYSEDVCSTGQGKTLLYLICTINDCQGPGHTLRCEGGNTKHLWRKIQRNCQPGKLWAWRTVDKFLWTPVNHVTSRTNVASTAIEQNVV